MNEYKAPHTVMIHLVGGFDQAELASTDGS